jgi:hypothetical protein
MIRTARLSFFYARGALSWACLIVGAPLGAIGVAIVIAGMRIADQERPR